MALLEKLLVFALTLVLATGMLVACGGEDEEGSSAGQKGSVETGETLRAEPEPIDEVRIAYKNTVAEETARVEFTVVTSGIPAGTSTSKGSGSMEFRMEGTGVLDLAGEKARMTMRMGPLGSFEYRMFGDTVYYKMPEDVRAQLPEVKPWIEMNLNSFYREQYGAGFSEMQAANPTDPTQQLEALRDVGSVEKVGEEKIRGASTTHYRAVVDLEKAAAQEGPELREAYEKMIEQMGASEVPTGVWLDEQGRVRRFQMDMKMNVPVPTEPSSDGATTEEQIRFTMTEDIFDFGVPVKVSPPPPAETTSFEDLEQRMRQRTG